MNNSKTFQNQCAQGDIFLRKIDKIPDNLVEVLPEKSRFIVAHSETGHHHWLPAEGCRLWTESNNPLVCYLSTSQPVALTHEREWDTHAPIMIPPGNYELRRQREYTPQGWRRVED